MVHINGKDIDVAGQTLKAYLDASEYEPGTFVVECNEQIVFLVFFEKHMLHDGDVVEIVQFMGGGAC